MARFINKVIFIPTIVLLCFVSSASAVTIKVGPVGGCGGSCDYNTLQSAIDAATAGDTLDVYRLTSGTGGCYNEHITINKALTIDGNSTSAATAACIGPTSGGDIVTITASNVTLKDLEISGKTAGGYAIGNGGRASGYGIHIYGNDIDGTVIQNCTVSFTYLDNIRWDGDRDGDGADNVTIQQSYIHHSDTNRPGIRIIGGSDSSNTHLIENCLITTNRGILVSRYSPYVSTPDVNYITIRKNIISGWSYWAHLALHATWPETDAGDASKGGGWRYFSRSMGIWNDTAGTNVTIGNNLIIGCRQGVRVTTTGTISNNTIVNPFNTVDYGYNSTISATDIRNNTAGILLGAGFAGTVENNIISVTSDNRASGQAGQSSTPYYTPGITGYGIAFVGTGSTVVNTDTATSSFTLGSAAAINYNQIYGFVDTNGSTTTAWGPAYKPVTNGGSILTHCGANNYDTSDGGVASNCNHNFYMDPSFAADGVTDTSISGIRYESYYNEYFEDSLTGRCVANVLVNSDGQVGFVDLSATTEPSALQNCTYTVGSTDSPAIDWGTGSVGSEPEKNGDKINIGAWGGTARATKSGRLRIIGVDSGVGTVKSDDNMNRDLGSVNARSAGINTINIYFNRQVTIPSSTFGNSFVLYDHCGTALSAPAGWTVTNSSSSAGNKVTLSWTTGYTDRAVKVRAVSNGGLYSIKDSENNEALDGEITAAESSSLPSGNGAASGNAEFVLYSLIGDSDGDLDVETDDRTDVNNLDNAAITDYPYLPEDVDSDNTVEGASGENDYDAVDNVKADYWVNSTSDSNALATTLRFALTNVSANGRIKFKIDTFKPCSAATTTLGSSYPNLDDGGVLVDASIAGVEVNGNAGNYTAFTTTSNSNTIRGLNITNMGSVGGQGIYISSGTSNVVGGTYSGTALNKLGQGCRIANTALYGIYITSSYNTVKGCLLGTDINGTAASALSTGIGIGANSNTIGGTSSSDRNIISGNSSNGLLISADYTLVQGNYIGLDINGTADLGNTSFGIYMTTSVDSNTIGGTSAGARNVIAGNDDTEINLNDGDYNVIQGNYIGTDKNGTTALGGSGQGIYVRGTSDSNTIGGTTGTTPGGACTGACNVISGNNQNGMRIDGSYNVVQGNYIGSDVNGTADVGNLNDGIRFNAATASNNTIGGTSSSARNILSGNTQNGIRFQASSNNTIYGNYIGVQTDGATALRNDDAGILFGNSATTNTIGGVAAGQGNLIALNGDSSATDAGLMYNSSSADGNFHRGNIIYGNAYTTKSVYMLVAGSQNSISAPSVTCADTDLVKGAGAANATIDIYTNNDNDQDCEQYIGSGTADGTGNFSIAGTYVQNDYVIVIQTSATDSSADSVKVQIGGVGTCN